MKTLRNRPEVINYTDNVIYDSDIVTIINEENKKLFFHIKDRQYYTETYNVAEAVAILMRIKSLNSDNILWNIKLSSDDKEIESTCNVILWLTGGQKTWNKLNLDWLDYYNHLDYEYNYQIKNILKMSSKLKDVKILFEDILSFDKLYNSILKYSI